MSQKIEIKGRGNFWACATCQALFKNYTDYISHKLETHGPDKEHYDGITAKQPELKQYEGGATRSAKPEYALIPKVALDCLAARMTLGEKKHGPNAWNAQAYNYDTALTTSWMIAGLEHVIGHCMEALKLIGKDGIIKLDSDESLFDHAGAIMFGGSVLAAFDAKIKKQIELRKKPGMNNLETNDATLERDSD